MYSRVHAGGVKMVTEISGAGLSYSAVVRASSPYVAETLSPNPSGTAPESFLRGIPDNNQLSTTAQVTGAFAQLRGRQEVLNNAASVVRDLVETAEKAELLLGKMSEELDVVVKMYPPYPIDNPDRVSLLNSFGGLRRQIDALTFPPPESVDAVTNLLDVQSLGKKASSTTSPASDLIKEPMWDILTLDPESASDEDVSKALEQINAMKSVLDDLKAGMWKDVVSFVEQVESPLNENVSFNLRSQLAEVDINKGGGQIGISRNAHQLEQAAESR